MAHVYSPKATYLNNVKPIVYQPGYLSSTLLALAAAFVSYSCLLAVWPTNNVSVLKPLAFLALAILFYHAFKYVYTSYRRRNSHRFVLPSRQRENHVLDKLAKLPNDFSVFHHVELPDGTHGHFVVTSTFGIFALRVKHIDGVVSFDGMDLFQNGAEIPLGDIVHYTAAKAKSMQDFINNQLDECIIVKPVFVLSKETIMTHFKFCELQGVVVVHFEQLNEYLIKHSSFKPIIKVDKINELLGGLLP